MTDTTIRAAEPADVHAIVGLIGELAAFEELTHLLRVQPSDLERHLFGERPVIECVVATRANAVVGFALFFTSFSTFLGRPGIWLEDLYVQSAHRATGVGSKLLVHLARLAVERGYARFEWSVLDWNAKAIAFYEKMGATVMPEWRICRVTGDRLATLARAT